MIPLLALILGLISAFAFEPFGWWPLMPLAILGLCELIDRAPTLRRSLLLGWLFGVGQFAVGLNWIATAFTFQAAMPAWLGWIAVVALSLYLAIYPMLAVGLAWKYGRDRPIALVLALAGGWAITEWLRATMFTGFAWNPVGVVLVDTPLLASSAFVGTYGLSMLVVLVGGMTWLARQRQWKPAAALIVVIGLLLMLPVPIEVSPNLKTLPAFPSAPPPAPVTPHSALVTGAVRIIQPNIGQADKWREGYDRIAAARLAGLSATRFPANRSAADTLFWPEAAVTEPLVDERAAAAVQAASERRRVASSIAPGQLLATGGLALTSSGGVAVDGATNSVFILDSGGTIVGRYDKAHLVPYGEYLPMRPILSSLGLSRLAPGDLDFRPGSGPRTLALPNGRKMAIQICYEIIFSGEVVDRASRPDYIFNPSNDAWFGTWGPPQHLAQARLRAAEEALPVIRSTPTGISAMIDARGRLVASVAGGESSVIDIHLPPAGQPTLFARVGNLIPLTLGFLLLLSAIALGRSRRYSTT